MAKITKRKITKRKTKSSNEVSWAAIRGIDTKGLPFIGSGVTGRVYRLSKDYIVKVYCNARGWYNRENSDLIALTQELDAGLSSQWVLPVEEIVIAKVRNTLYYGAIKKFVEWHCSWTEIRRFGDKLPYKLQWDLHGGNVRKDNEGRLWLIDSHDDSPHCLGE